MTIDHPGHPAPVNWAPQAAPTQPRRARRWPWIVLSVVVLLAMCAGGVPVALVYGVASAADHGETCPRCAADAWLDYLSPLWQDQDGQQRVSKDLAPEHQRTLLARRESWLATVNRDGRKHPPMAAPKFVTAGGDQETNHGTSRVIIVLSVAAQWTVNQREPMFYVSGYHPWTFDIRHDRKGWRIWSVTMPSWCGTYSRCDAPPPSPATAVSPSPSEDPYGYLRPMLPCGPKDPFRQYHSCPPS